MKRETMLIKSGVLQADTGQTTIATTPRWARSAIFQLSVSEATGTSPLTDYKLRPVQRAITAAPVVATGTAGAANEVQTLVLSSWDATDTIKLTYDAVETGAVTYSATPATNAAAFQAALVALAAFAPGDVVVTATDINTYVFTFGGAFANTDVSALTATSGTGSAAGVFTETIKGIVSTADEVQTITLTGGPTDGTFTVQWTGSAAKPMTVSTGPISATATAAEFQRAWNKAFPESNASFRGSDIVVTRSGAGTTGSPYVFTLSFTGATARDQNVDAVTVTGTGLFSDAAVAVDYMGWDGITQIAGTTSGQVFLHLGPMESDTADDTGAIYQLQSELPEKLAHLITFDRTSSNEKYTYSLYATYIG